MSSVELIRKLSEQGARDLAESLSWINPLPKNAVELVEKIDVASQRLSYAQGRQGSTEKDDTTSQRAVLSRLKSEIESILKAG